MKEGGAGRCDGNDLRTALTNSLGTEEDGIVGAEEDGQVRDGRQVRRGGRSEEGLSDGKDVARVDPWDRT